MSLVIVESPNKIKAISQILGPKYQVIPTVGHFRDLDPKDLSIDMATYEPIYVLTKPAVFQKLKKAAIGKTVYLATDDDREGEAISQHVLEALKLKTYHRLLFNEISQTAIMRSLRNKTKINDHVVASQKTRRVIDRLYGWLVSPMLKKHFKQNLSAGRVQSVATRIIVDRHVKVKEALKQSAGDEYQVSASIDDKTWQLYKNGAIKKLASYDQAIVFSRRCAVSTLSIRSIADKLSKENPPPPYDTASIQQDAFSKLGLTTKTTMGMLQKLYEEGAITYIRTKSHHLSEDAHKMIQAYLKPNQYQRRDWPTNGGHEAIRPTDISKMLDSKLYQLIWRRTVASQMSAASVSTRTIQLDISKYLPYTKRRYFQTQIRVVTEPGYLAIYGVEPEKIVYEPKSLILRKMIVSQCTPTIPSRFTESSFLTKIKSLGIGSPSTYASIISTIQDREYVKVIDVPGQPCKIKRLTLQNKKITIDSSTIMLGAEKKRLVPTPLGIKVTEYLVAKHPELVDYQLTSAMEVKLDAIAEGKLDWKTVVSEYHRLICSNVPIQNHQIIEGKYGPYIRVHGKNISIPKGLKPADVTDELIQDLLKTVKR